MSSPVTKEQKRNVRAIVTFTRYGYTNEQEDIEQLSELLSYADAS